MPDQSQSYRDQQELDDYRLNEDLKNGPVHKRKCTDWWCCCVFLAFLAAMIVISVYGFANGNPEALATPYDSDLQFCGTSEGYEDYPYLFFANPVNQANSGDVTSFTFNTVCVKRCPFYSDRDEEWRGLIDPPSESDEDFSDGDKEQVEEDHLDETKQFSDGHSDEADGAETDEETDNDETEEDTENEEEGSDEEEADTQNEEEGDGDETDEDEETDAENEDEDEEELSSSSDDTLSYQEYLDELTSWLDAFNAEYDGYSWEDFYETSQIKCKPNSVIDDCYIDYVNLFLFDSWPFLGRYCVPNFDTDFMQTYYEEFLEYLNVSETMEQWISDCYLTVWIIIASAGFAVVIGLIYMVLLQLLAPIIIYLMVVCIFAILVLAGWFCYDQSQNYEEDLPEDSSWDSQKTMFWLAIIFWVSAGVFFLVFVCLYHKIRVAIGVIKTAAQFIRKELSIVFFPLVVAVMLISFYVYWVWSAVYIYSLGSYEPESGAVWGDFDRSDEEKYMFYYHLFALLWMNEFLLAWGTFVIASSACIWYFNHGVENSSIRPIRTSIWRATFYHMGSLAFGSFILAVIQAVRLVLAYMNVSFFKMLTFIC